MDTHFETIEAVLSNAKKLGATYAECRICPEREEEEIRVENGQITALSAGQSAGFAVRVLVEGSWGFYGGTTLDRQRIQRGLERAVTDARSNAFLQREPVELVGVPQWQGGRVARYRTAVERDPRAVPQDEKIALLMLADDAMRAASGRVFWRIAEYSSRTSTMLFGSTDGVRIDETITECHGAVYAHVGKEGEREHRSAPDSHAYFMQGGFETVVALDLPGKAAQIAEEAEALLSAPPVPAGKRPVILLPPMLNLHLHETMHGFEADRVLGSEWTTAGGSFLTPLLSQIGTFSFGSPEVTVYADGHLPGGAGTFGHDAEGMSAGTSTLVDKGVWTGLLNSRETIPRLHTVIGREYFTKTTGSVRVADVHDWPLVRMTNIMLAPGGHDFDTLCDDAPEGTIMFGTNRGWSIDDVRRHFLFSVEIAWEKVGNQWQLRRRGKYSGDTLAFWRQCKAVCGPEWFEHSGAGSCAKGDPVQLVHVTHGSSPALFLNVSVGSVGR